MSPVARRLSLLVVLPALILSACLIIGPEEESAGSGTLQFTEVTHTERACDGLQGQVDGLVLMGVRHADRFEIRDGVLRIGVAPDAPAPALTMEFVEAE